MTQRNEGPTEDQDWSFPHWTNLPTGKEDVEFRVRAHPNQHCRLERHASGAVDPQYGTWYLKTTDESCPNAEDGFVGCAKIERQRKVTRRNPVGRDSYGHFDRVTRPVQCKAGRILRTLESIKNQGQIDAVVTEVRERICPGCEMTSYLDFLESEGKFQLATETSSE